MVIELEQGGGGGDAGPADKIRKQLTKQRMKEAATRGRELDKLAQAQRAYMQVQPAAVGRCHVRPTAADPVRRRIPPPHPATAGGGGSVALSAVGSGSAGDGEAGPRAAC